MRQFPPEKDFMGSNIGVELHLRSASLCYLTEGRSQTDCPGHLLRATHLCVWVRNRHGRRLLWPLSSL